MIILIVLIIALLFILKHLESKLTTYMKLSNSLFEISNKNRCDFETLKNLYSNAISEIEGMRDLEIFLKEVIDEQDQCYKDVIRRRNKQIRRLRKKIKVNNESIDDFLEDFLEELFEGLE